jgi:predicted DCC family thiol-disulfide oxidoreductase YuxK
MSELEKPILFFDGVCGLCNRFVDFSLKHDPHGRVLFAPLQGKTAGELLSNTDLENLDTVIFYENGSPSHRSTAIVKLLSGVGGLWTVLAWLLWLIPRPLRNFGYRVMAKNRYRFFGQKESCRLPTPEERTRFLD